jgi:hypothetical protein
MAHADRKPLPLRKSEQRIRDVEDIILVAWMWAVLALAAVGLWLSTAYLLGPCLSGHSLAPYVSLPERFAESLAWTIRLVHGNWSVLLLVSLPFFIRVMRKQLEQRRVFPGLLGRDQSEYWENKTSQPGGGAGAGGGQA